MLERKSWIDQVRRDLRLHPIVALIGARQVGKTTLSRQVAASARGAVHTFDLEDPAAVARLGDPMATLRSLRGLVVLDEVQRRPELFPILRVLADRHPLPARFLILGSASPDLLRQGSETLAGRIVYRDIDGLSLAETGADTFDRLWTRGGFPRSFLARSERESLDWREAFIRTFLERDLPQLGFRTPAATLHRFWSMLAHWHGQIWNGAEFARAFGVAETTVRNWLDLLSGTLVVRVLKPWHANLAKRQVRAPRVYLADSGLAHSLLGIADREQLQRHPKVGATFEGFVIAQLVRQLGVEWRDCHWWRTQQGAELDLLVEHRGKLLGFEMKRTEAPERTRSMMIALEDLRLDEIVVLHAGEHSFPLHDRIRAVPARRLLDEIAPLR